MVFWAYMLHCKGGYFYTGHTEDLEHRMAQYASGETPGFVRDHWPAKLVWSAEFPTRYEALAAERQIKGWSRAKKLALIRGDWADISALAAKGKNSPSTSSGRTGEGNETSSGKPVSVFLHPHLDHLPSEQFALEVTVRRSGDRLHLRYRLTGPVSLVRVPPSSPPQRRDGLWQRTCFEAFVRQGGGPEYCELNLSPSGEWAAYRFDFHRHGMTTAEMESPSIRAESDQYRLELVATAAIGMGGHEVSFNLAAVIEETDGTKSYWALAHPPGPPDFHHPDCFALTLPAPGGA